MYQMFNNSALFIELRMLLITNRKVIRVSKNVTYWSIYLEV